MRRIGFLSFAIFLAISIGTLVPAGASTSGDQWKRPLCQYHAGDR